MATTIVNGYKIKMRLLDAVFYELWGNRAAPKNIQVYNYVIICFFMMALILTPLWFLSHIPFIGIEMLGVFFGITAFFVNYHAYADCSRAILVAIIISYLQYTKTTFGLTLVTFNVEQYYYNFTLAACALVLLRRIYNHIIWYRLDKITKRYQLPIVSQQALREHYFDGDPLKQPYKSQEVFNSYEEAEYQNQQQTEGVKNG